MSYSPFSSSKDRPPSVPYRRYQADKDCGGSRHGDSDDGKDTFDCSGDSDNGKDKGAPRECLRRWRRATVVLNAFRSFYYTLYLRKEQERKQARRTIRALVQVIRASFSFIEGGEKPAPGAPGGLPVTPTGDYGISQEQLTRITIHHNCSALQEHGGVKGIADLLKTDLEKGISGDDNETGHRRSIFGENSYTWKKGHGFWTFLWEACQDLYLIVLMIAASASLALGIKTEGIGDGWYDGGSMAFTVIIVIVVRAVSDHRQSLQFQNLIEEKQNIKLEVIRGGRRIEASNFDIVVGDIVHLKIGDQVPADGIFISGHSLAIGESKLVHKDHKEPFLMSGCKVADGYGTMLVTNVGRNTLWGSPMAITSVDTQEVTCLQGRLNDLATFIGIVDLLVAFLVLAVLLARYITGNMENTEITKFQKGLALFIGIASLEVAFFVLAVLLPRRFNAIMRSTVVGNFQTEKESFGTAVEMLAIAATVGVVVVPEGLPLAATLVLAYSMKKMMAEKALVRRLSACEIVGSATTIFCDKTGTLTLNEMTVVEAYVCGVKIDPPENIQDLSPDVSNLLIEGIAQNTTAGVFVPEDGGAVEVTGSPIEKAILTWGVKLGMKFDDVRSQAQVLNVFPFNSEKKHAGVALLLEDPTVRIHWKGAAEIVLTSCKSWLRPDGSVHPLDQDQVAEFEKAIEDMAGVSSCCVAFAYGLYEKENVLQSEEECDQWKLPVDDLVLLAIVGIKDPCRPDVEEAVQLCKNACVKFSNDVLSALNALAIAAKKLPLEPTVCKVTGDNLQTARAIALECGILESGAATYPTVIEGGVFRALPDFEREEVADCISVMWRSSPNDKLLLVQSLRRKGHVVAVAGDGTDDAPAFHEADIGLAMGIQGIRVAKESSDGIILDDSFASVVKVVQWGRSVYANIQKCIQFQLTIHIAALVINVVAAFFPGNVPLNAVQLLWINFIVGTLGALALATEPPTDHLMLRPPVGRREPLITNSMWRNIVVQALYQVAVLLVLYFRGKNILRLKFHDNVRANKVNNTVIFNAFALCQIFNEFNARRPDEMNVFSGITKNHLFMEIVGITVVLQVLIIEFHAKFTSTVRLNWNYWLACIAIAVISWPLALIGKVIPVPEEPLTEYFSPLVRYSCSFCRSLCGRQGVVGGAPPFWHRMRVHLLR